MERLIWDTILGNYRYQVGGWRILYEVNEAQKVVTVYGIKPRGDVY
jgi:mRNA-degrading endonuclease RelE of RelBE toxin-antitoxin system